MKELNMVKEALVTSYKMIDLLESKIKALQVETSTLPWENKTSEQGSYNTEATPVPTPAVENLATGMIRQMVVRTYNDSKAAIKRIYAENDRIVIWKNGVVTTLGESINTKNPLAVFKSRACARINLRKVGYILPPATSYEGRSAKKYILCFKPKSI
jgi:hypothetical protein